MLRNAYVYLRGSYFEGTKTNFKVRASRGSYLKGAMCRQFSSLLKIFNPIISFRTVLKDLIAIGEENQIINGQL